MVSLSETLRESILKQSEHELLESHLYLQAYHWFEVRHFSGFANKMKEESEKERGHFKSLVDYVTIRDDSADYITLRCEPVEIRVAPLPEVKWTDEISVFEYFLELEKKGYENAMALFAQARSENDFDAEHLIEELVESLVKSLFEWEGIVKRVKSYSLTPGLIWQFDKSI